MTMFGSIKVIIAYIIKCTISNPKQNLCILLTGPTQLRTTLACLHISANDSGLDTSQIIIGFSSNESPTIKVHCYISYENT